MRKLSVSLFLVSALVISCNQFSNKQSGINYTDSLATQLFKININQDTVLKTLDGALINIEKGSLSGSDSSVQLEIKEAYSLQEIIKARLTTMSNGEPLSSGGMIYINAAGGQDVKILKPIKVSIPTKFLNNKMQLFKGEQTDSGINWTDPVALADNPQTKKIDEGEQLFKTNCAGCHKVDVDFTAPALSYIIKPGASEGNLWMYNYIRYGIATDSSTSKIIAQVPENTAPESNDQSSIIPLDNHAESWFDSIADMNFSHINCMRSYFGSRMPLYPSLSNNQLDKLFTYVQNETERLGVPYPNDNYASSLDSCKRYFDAKNKLLRKRNSLLKDTVKQKIRDYNPPAGYVPSATPPVYPDNEVKAEDNKSLYYQFNIQVFGWYNTDALLNYFDNKIETQLRVRIVGEYKADISVSLAVPVINTFLEGGKLSNGDDYGFFTKDGMIPLPKNAKAYIIAMGETNGQITYSIKQFIVSEKQDIEMDPAPSTVAAFNESIASISSDNIKITAVETKTGKDLEENDKELKEAEKLKPIKCDCSCWQLEQ